MQGKDTRAPQPFTVTGTRIAGQRSIGRSWGTLGSRVLFGIYLAGMGLGSSAVEHPAGTIITVAGKGTQGFSGDGGPATAAGLNPSMGLAVDALGNLFIADTGNNRIRKVDVSSGVISTVAGTGVEGFSGDGGPATAAQLRSPWGVTVDGSGNLFISDTYNNRIRKVDASSGVISTAAGDPTTRLVTPRSAAVDAFGNLFIGDPSNFRIRKVAAADGAISLFAGSKTEGFSGDGGLATAAALYGPLGVVVDASGNLFIADSGNNRIRRVAAADGTISTVAGTGVNGFAGDAGPATTAQLNGPSSVAMDSAGNLFIADKGNNRIRKVAVTDGVISTVAGSGVEGFSGDGGPALAARLRFPLGVAVDPFGNLFIADTDNTRIREVFGVAAGAPTGLKGDLTGDGKVDLKDVTSGLQIAIGNLTASPAELANGDVNGDGRIDLKDVTRILQTVVNNSPL